MSKWKPPKDMPKDQVKAVLKGWQCGAKKKGGKGYCKMKPIAGQVGQLPHRCKFHGGASPGGPAGNLNAFKYGIYTNRVLPGEEDMAEHIRKQDLTVSDEILIMKLRLNRAIRARDDQEKLMREGTIKEQQDGMILDRIASEKGMGAQGPVNKTSVEKKFVDYEREIHNLTNRIHKLVNQEAILRGGEGAPPEERARQANAALKAFEDSLEQDAADS